MPTTRRIAIVIPWFGRELKGGAELHAWQLAARLAARKHAVEVLTTCCASHSQDWATNHLPAGVTGEAHAEGFTVMRFEVEPRDGAAFDGANGRLLAADRASLKPGVSPVSAEDEAVFCHELIRSPELLAFLAQNRERYDAVILLPYLYGPVIEGIHAAAGRALLQPCLHDEAYAYLPAVARSVYAADRLLFLSEGERELALRLFGPGIAQKSILTGAGVDVAAVEPDDAVLAPMQGERFVLCLGRKDPGKKTDFIARCFARYRREHPESRLALVIAGPGHVTLPADCPGLVDMGVVTEAQKRSLLRHCAALFHPSENESYSRVIMEAWLEGRPAAANENCLATATAVSRGGGGWLAGNEDQWTALFGVVDGAPPRELDALGEKGREYAAQVASWDAVIGRYESVIEDLVAQRAPASSNAGVQSLLPVHQVLPNVAVGDAISDHALWIKHALRSMGHPSQIFAIGIDAARASDTGRFTQGCIQPGDAVIYHHSIGSAVTPEVVAHRGPKCLIYHNITPAHFLEPYFPLHTRLCREGREELPALAAHFPASVGDSTYNAIELAESGFRSPGVLPICVDPAKWQRVADAALMARLQDGRTNVLFVGRLSPNKKQEDLIFAFAKLRALDPSARLILVGTSVTTNDLYLECLQELCVELGVGDAVEFTGHVSDEQLAAYYRTAHLFWSMSEHEGFCVPLVEAMWFDVPVFAFASSAIPETMGNAGRLFFGKQDAAGLAAQALDLARDPATRRRIIESQRERRKAFLSDAVLPRLQSLVARMIPSEAAVPTAPPPREIDPASVRRIAVVKLDHIGDVLLASPSFQSLKRRFPNATLTAVVAPPSVPIVRDNPYVDEVVAYDAPWFWREVPGAEEVSRLLAANAASMERLMAGHYDLVVNLRSDLGNLLWSATLPHAHLLSYTNDSPYSYLITHPLTRTRGMHITEQHRELLATIGADSWTEPVLYPSQEDRASAAPLAPLPGTVAVFAGAGIPLKCWSPMKFRELVTRLRRDGVPVSIVGSAADRELADEIAGASGALNLCGRFTLPELGVFLEGCAALVTNDSAPMHIGAAAGTRVVYITRPNTVGEFGPIGSQHLRCCLEYCANPCGGFDPNTRGELAEVCRCIQAIGVDEVEAKVWTALGEDRVFHRR